MELTHDFIVPAAVEDVWSTFMDLERVGGCFPGATVTEATGDTFAGTVKVKLGPIALQYAGTGSFIERDDAAHRAVIEAKGKDKRGNGTAGATVTMQLAPAEGGSATRVDVTTELAITGKPAQFGRGVMQDVSDKLLQQFIGCIEGQFADSPAATDGASAAAPSSGGESAEQDASEVAESEGMATAVGNPASAVAGSGPGRAAPTRAALPVPQSDDAVDLGATVLPVLVKSYAPHAVGALLAIALGYLLGRRRS